MEAGSKIKVSAGPHSLEGSRGRPFLASSKLVRLLASLPVLGSYVQRPQPPPLSSLGILPVSVCLWSHSSLLMKLPVVGLGPTPILYDHIWIQSHMQRPHFQIRSQSQVLGVRASVCFLGGHNSTHNITPVPTRTTRLFYFKRTFQAMGKAKPQGLREKLAWRSPVTKAGGRWG